MLQLKKLRKEKGLTFKELSKELKKHGTPISADSLAKYERGARRPKVENIRAIAEYFGVSTAYLQGLTDKRNETFTPEQAQKFLDDYFNKKVLPGKEKAAPYDISTIKELSKQLIKQNDKYTLHNYAGLMLFITDHVLTGVPVSKTSRNEAHQLLDNLLDKDN